MTMRQLMVVPFSIAVLFLCVVFVYASPLTFVSDLISTSAPGADASHTIQFTAANAIPVSGHITITLPAGDFSIPPTLDYSDIDLAVASGVGPYIDRSLAAVSSATDDGVTVVTGSNGSITFTLNSTSGIAAGDRIQIRIGTNATVGGTGIHSIANPVVQASYRIRIATTDASSVSIDNGTAMIAVVYQVSVSSGVVVFPPVISNGLPSGMIAAGSANVELSFDTNELAHCRYSTTSGVAYAAMTNVFSPSVGTTFFTVVNGLQDATTYTYYVRCIEIQGVANPDDYVITFTLAPTPTEKTSGGGGGNGIVGSGGTGPYPNGSAVLYLASVTLSGSTTPLSTITALTDGKNGVNTQSKSDGNFSLTLASLERGVYTFQLYATDNQGKKSETVSSTLTLGSASANTISGIVLKFSTSTATTATSTSASAGGHSDLNGDGKVNLVDFSILLTSWGKSNSAVDFNGDGKVNLADFSILLFNWTG